MKDECTYPEPQPEPLARSLEDVKAALYEAEHERGNDRGEDGMIDAFWLVWGLVIMSIVWVIALGFVPWLYRWMDDMDAAERDENA